MKVTYNLTKVLN